MMMVFENIKAELERIKRVYKGDALVKALEEYIIEIAEEYQDFVWESWGDDN